MRDEFIGGTIGTALGMAGTATATNDVLQTISLILTILGAVVSFIVVPVVNWIKDAKKDGKITADEIGEGAHIVEEGVKKAKDAIDEAGKDN